MIRQVIALGWLSLFVSACGGGGFVSPTTPGSPTNMSGTWSGTATDSSTQVVGSGGMMGQAGMGTMTWQLTQNGTTVTGTMGFSGMPAAMMGGTLSGTISGADLTFTMDMPAGSMMSAACSAHVTGSMHLDTTTMTMTGTYTGTNSCAGPFSNGQMTMTRR